MVNKGSYNRYMTRLIEEPAIGSSYNSGLPSESYLWVPIVLNAMGGSEWAGRLVEALPSQAELQADGAPENWNLDDLVAAVKEAIWGDSASVYLRAGDIAKRRGGFIYLKPAFQEQLSTCLQNHPAYKGAQTWMLARFNRARDTVMVLQFTPCTTALDNNLGS